MTDPIVKQCTANTAAGTRCQNPATGGGDLCHVHAKAAETKAADPKDKDAGINNPPDVSGEVPGTKPEDNPPPPPNPPDVGNDRPEGVQRFPPPPPPPEPLDSRVAQADRGRPSPQVTEPPKATSRKAELLKKLLADEITEEETDELVAIAARAGNPSPLAPGTPTTDLPTAPPRRPDGSIPTLPGQTEGTTQGQSPASADPEKVTFNSGDHQELKQVLPDSQVIEFHGGYFTTSNSELIRMLRERINQPGALYYEDDPAAILKCPFCRFTSPSEAKLRQHIQKAH